MTNAYLLAYSGSSLTSAHKEVAGDENGFDRKRLEEQDLLRSMDDLERQGKEHPSHADILKVMTTLG